VKHVIEPELREICQDIVDRDQSLDEWREMESSDEFQGELYHGGFEAEEDAFCFSYDDPDGAELVFKFTLEEAEEIASGAQKAVEAREAGDD
jgi:hypothetical protein